MYIEKIIIENIKSIKRLEFNPNNRFNILVGQNNIGKTTIFDALLLWKIAYQKLILSDGKGFYKKTSYNSMNVSFSELLLLRIINAKDLFNDPTQEASIAIMINCDNSSAFNLKITIDKPNIENSYIRFRNESNLSDFQNFASFCVAKGIKLKDAIFINFTKPLAFIVKEEPFLNKGLINKKMFLGLNPEILRNKILSTMKVEKFEYLDTKLKEVTNQDFIVHYKNKNRDEEYIKINISNGGKEVDIALIGSGILHMLEIFSSLYQAERNELGLNIFLIDEPDSHLHGKLQQSLIDVIKKEQSQIFIITHNDKLIEKANEGELFFVTQSIIDGGQLNSQALNDYNIVNSSLSRISGARPIIITEGKTDWKHLKKTLEKFKNQGLYSSLDIEFLEYEENIRMGDSALDSMVEAFKKTPQSQKIIFMFDRDNDTYTRKYANQEFNDHSNNIYSFCIPKISDELDIISLEFYYKEDDLKVSDTNQRRLFIGKEFYKSGNSNCGNFETDKKDKCEKLVIIDEKVFKKEDLAHTTSIALSKNAFAEYILNDEENFNEFDIENFKKIFDLIEKIIREQ